ncbi:MAG: hypothetical protein HY909_10360 [Deltaproteobacteria bacterium]|nr:hypothetical protein [Deltaproteobacteria bacterium]
MDELSPCAHCNRHVRGGTERCPFCQESLSPSAAGVRCGVTVALALAAGLSLAACYGGPPHPQGYSPRTTPQGEGTPMQVASDGGR